jgi:hypothetical protein
MLQLLKFPILVADCVDEAVEKPLKHWRCLRKNTPHNKNLWEGQFVNAGAL